MTDNLQLELFSQSDFEEPIHEKGNAVPKKYDLTELF